MDNRIYQSVAQRLRDWKLKTFHFPSTKEDFRKMEAVYTDDELLIGPWEVMQGWETPLMEVMAKCVTANGGHVLEVGFGMGISAGFLIEGGCSKYTVIEPHPAVLEKAREWAERQPVPVEIVEGFWQDEIDKLGQFDGILFDTFPLTKEEAGQDFLPFIPKASQHLKPGGLFTYYSDAPDTLAEDHLALVMDHFDEVRILKVSGLEPARDCQYWQQSTMLVPVCRKGTAH